MSKFNVGDRVRAVDSESYSKENGFAGATGSVKRVCAPYFEVTFDVLCGVYSQALFCERELELIVPKHTDVTGRAINIGDVIVYFTRKGSGLYSQKAKVEFIGTKTNTGPHIRVLREDAVEKDKFTRKAWLWSFDNSVRVG